MGLLAAAELAVEEHDARRDLDARPQQAAKRVRQTPMERYKARGQISDQQFTDGERLWADYMQSGFAAQVTAKYGVTVPSADPAAPGGGPRYMAYQDAMRAVGIILSPVLSWVVCDGEPADQWALKQGRPASDGIAALRFALDALGKHYRR